MLKQDPADSKKRYIFAFALAVSLVGLWGFGHRVHDSLVPLFANVFHLHGLRFALISSLYNIVYILGAVPAALYARRFGYKAAILLGLGFVAVGSFTFYPAAETLAFGYYLTATVFLALGWLTLEVAANPLFVAWGSPERAVLRLNLAQSLYPLGALVGILVGRWLLTSELALPQAESTHPLAHPYIVLGACVLLLAFVFEETLFPAVAQDRIPGLKGIRGEIKTLLAQPRLRFAMLTQFCGVVAVGLTWAMATDAVRSGTPYLPFLKPPDGFLLCMTLFAIGRFLGTALMTTMSPAIVLLLYAGGGALMAAIAAVCGGGLVIFGLIGLGLALSITWPTILGLAIQNLGQDMKMATALIAICGALGAVGYHMALTAGSGLTSVTELVITALCCAVIASYAWTCAKSAKTS